MRNEPIAGDLGDFDADAARAAGPLLALERLSAIPLAAARSVPEAGAGRASTACLRRELRNSPGSTPSGVMPRAAESWCAAGRAPGSGPRRPRPTIDGRWNCSSGSRTPGLSYALQVDQAVLWLERGELDKAAASLQQAIQLDGQRDLAYATLAAVRQRQGQTAGGSEALLRWRSSGQPDLGGFVPLASGRCPREPGLDPPPSGCRRGRTWIGQSVSRSPRTASWPATTRIAAGCWPPTVGWPKPSRPARPRSSGSGTTPTPIACGSTCSSS